MSIPPQHFTADSVGALLGSPGLLTGMVDRLVDAEVDLDPIFLSNPSLLGGLVERARAVAASADEQRSPEAELDRQRVLRRWIRLQTSAPSRPAEVSCWLNVLGLRLAKDWLAALSSRAEGPPLPSYSFDAFAHWFSLAVEGHAAVDHPLYAYLETEADLDGFRHFVTQEQTVDTDFADFIALAQVGPNLSHKREMAQNYWEEMGHGDPTRVHASMFRAVLVALGIMPDEDALGAGALACGNLLYLLSKHRCYRHLAVGALAVTELAVPRRFQRIMGAARRLDLPPEVNAYYALHVEADSDHAAGWLSDVVAPMIQDDPRAAPAIATGVMLRLMTSNAYCEQILGELRAGGRADTIAHQRAGRDALEL